MKRKNLVIVGLLVLGWVIFLGQPGIVSTRLRKLFVGLGTPFIKLSDSIPAMHTNRQLEIENKKLRDDNAVLRQQVRNFAEAAQQNVELTRLLTFRQQLPLRTIGARVIGRDASNWWRSIQIDRGTDDKVAENLAVVTADGLVGKVVCATRNEARVLLLLDPNCKASAILQNSREIGTVTGPDTAFVRTPQYVMTYVRRDAKTQPGEAVITSGLGGVFPKGLLIGTVVSSQLNQQNGMFQDIAVNPAVNYRRLEEVLVILP